jgi:uncharacterized protein (TIGR02145 family)
MPFIMKKVLAALFTVLILLGSKELHAQFTLHNNATNIGDGCFRLTQNQPSQSGAIWKTGLFNMNESWDLQADVLLGGNADGAEGIAFVLKTASSGFIGGSGGLMGFGGDFFTTAISPSVIIEMDTSQDEGLGDPAYHHIGIQKNGSNVHLGDDLIAVPVPAVPGNASITDNAYHSLRVTFDAGTFELVVYFDNVQRISATVDVAEILGTNSIKWGFTAATGSATNNHRVCNAELVVTEDDFEIVYGCTTSNACNYNSDATDDDGSCIPSGCMEPDACNYNALAECDGVACEYSCCPGPGCCLEGTTWDADLGGCIPTESSCPQDLDFDGVVGVNDLMELLSSFGLLCEEPETGEFTCGDAMNYHGYDYATVQIGEQCWFAENLRNEHYANGDTIPGDLSDSEWESTTEGAQAIYNNDVSNLADYGRLYNWYAVDDARGLCPSGWHVPTDGEFITLEMELGMSESEANDTGWRGTDQGTQMKSSPEDSPSWNGTNTSGFSGLAGGFRIHDGVPNALGGNGYFWSASSNGIGAWFRILSVEYFGVQRFEYNQRDGMSIRCIKETEE